MVFRAPEYHTRVIDDDSKYNDARRQAEQENIERMARAILELKGENGRVRPETVPSEK